MTYTEKKKKLIDDFLVLKSASNSNIGLNKNTSNLFRDRSKTQVNRLDVRKFDSVIKIDKINQTVQVEGMTTYEDLVKATLKHNLLPMVVPELKTITIGGAVAGLGIESSSFEYGLAHESVKELDVLLASGKVITCRPDNQYSDLFYAMPNSYGTLGYVLRIKADLRKASPYVRIKHLRFTKVREFFNKLEQITISKLYEGQQVNYVDGTIFSLDKMYITLGFDSDTVPYISDYTFTDIYYKSIAKRQEDYLTTNDYIWRWDTDWFWCSKNLLMENIFIRRIVGKNNLGSGTYSRLMRLSQNSKLIKTTAKIRGNGARREAVIQDVEIPIDKAEDFLKWFKNTIEISPIWVCPTKSMTKNWPYPLYPMNPRKIYINFGFWDSIPAKANAEDGHFNKLIERKVSQLGGMKSLYSNSYYNREQFEDIYNYKEYRKLKNHYDSEGYFKDLYEKTVL
jgi:FAD/FMN-containing dehydrogenase